MGIARILWMACTCAATALCPVGGTAAEAAGYSITGRIAGTGGSWDYAVIDPDGARLYLAQTGVTAVDLKTNAITTGLVAAAVTHGLALLGKGIVAVDDSQNKTVTLFDGITGRIESIIPTSKFNPVSGHHALDALVLEPKTGELVAVNGESGLLLLIDVALVQTLPTQIGTRLGAVDIESGRVYLPSAKFGPPKPPIPYPSVLPGSFEILVVSPH